VLRQNPAGEKSMTSYDHQFFIDSVALLLGHRTSHMGVHQYADHMATRYGKPMSGVALWQEIEHNHRAYYIPTAERQLIASLAVEVNKHVPPGTPFVDLGPGTLKTVAEKSLPILRAIQSNLYVPIDTCMRFCSEAGSVVRQHLPEAEVLPCFEHFFADDAAPACDRQSLAFLGGIIIANIEAPLSKEPPKAQLVRHLGNLARITNGGWLLASTDANQDEDENRAMYFENALIEINHFFRMAEELPFTGFDPYAFEYDPYWIAESSQLGHTAIATKDMRVTVRSPYWSGVMEIEAGRRFHLKNSFKYRDEFFTSCAEGAGFKVMKKWAHHDKPMRLFLLRAMQNACGEKHEIVARLPPARIPTTKQRAA
jgi:uncharacterized SAM-dependent methyltransferase